MTPTRATTRRAFTLTEALVAVIAIAIISVGLAAIFASVGDTVQRGRRISAINQYAASIERRIRTDLSSITREGFLVIRNEYAGSGNEDDAEFYIPLSEEDPLSRRLRRVDELMFFARGGFVSARGALSPETGSVRSREARIYYGHGERQVEGGRGFFRTYLDDPNSADIFGSPDALDPDSADPPWSLGLVKYPGLDALGPINPNRFAGDWTLLRHATLLKTPAPLSELDIESDPLGDSLDPEQVADNELQIGRQIAADSIFRTQAYWGEPQNTSNRYEDEFEDFSYRGAQAPPTFSSGVVDVATESLTDIRRRVMGLAAGTNPFTGSGSSGGSGSAIWVETPSSIHALEGRWSPWRRPRADGSPTSPAALYENTLVVVAPEARQSLVHVQHAWMADALPGASNELTYTSPISSGSTIPDVELVTRDIGLGSRRAQDRDLFSPLYPLRSRMRYEQTPPGYNADVFGPELNDDFATNRVENSILLAAARADQQMVTNSQFIPRCTEFIVEFSFGERYTDARLADLVDPPANPDDLLGELVWYGAPRPLDSGVPIAGIRPGTARPTPNQNPGDLEPGEVPTDQPLSFDQQRLLERHLLADLVVGELPSALDRFQSVPPQDYDADEDQITRIRRSAAQVPTSFYFGYADPRAVPVDDFLLQIPGQPAVQIENTGFDINGDGYRDDIDGDGVYDDAWPWPRLLRITMSFADPIDQTVEDTFQFVVELPKDGDL